MSRISFAALCALLSAPATALEMPADPVQRVALIAAIPSLAHYDCPGLDGDRDAAHAAVRANGVTPAEMANEPYASAVEEWVQAFHADASRRYCNVFLRAFGPRGVILPGLVHEVAE